MFWQRPLPFILFKIVAKYHWMHYIVFITMPTSTSTIPRNSRSLTFIIRLVVPMTSTKSSNLCVQINEIVTTGKLSKLEHFENDEKVMHNMIWTCSATFVNINIIHFEGTDHQFIQWSLGSWSCNCTQVIWKGTPYSWWSTQRWITYKCAEDWIEVFWWYQAKNTPTWSM